MFVNKKDIRDIAAGVAFLAPNICGFLAFTFIPLVVSLIMAFSNWNLEMHNVFKDTSVTFVGFDNFIKLFSERDFSRYLGNTLFFMMGIPFGVGGSLLAAILLSSDFKVGNKKIWLNTVVTIGLIVGCGMLVIAGMGATALTILICGIVGVIIIGGSLGGQTVYRTLFYFPHFTAGVATFILWKKLYNPQTGPINNALRPLLNTLVPKFASTPQPLATTISVVMLLIGASLCLYVALRMSKAWNESDSGTVSLAIANILLSVPFILAYKWLVFISVAWIALVPVVFIWLRFFMIVFRGQEHKVPLDKGMSNSVIICGAVMAFSLIVLGLSNLMYSLPTMSSDGLNVPEWLNNYNWAKPSLMIMGFWAAVGSNNMLLYMAGLSGISQDLYEAADIDGANSFHKFCHITWPQLANITFFILVMSIIGGLQGGFEMAKTMTDGGPAGATTTLSYYIYTEGFATGRLGYASAVSWTLFAIVFSVTLFNWKFGNKYTND